MTQHNAEPAAQLSDDAVERHIAGLSGADFEALVARARPADTPAQPTVPPVPLTPYEIALAQNERKHTLSAPKSINWRPSAQTTLWSWPTRRRNHH